MSLSSLLMFFRSVYKVILHTLTGQTEIERIARRNDPFALQKSIDLSKQLVNYREHHCQWQEPYSHELAQQLCAIKNIRDKDAQFRVDTTLNILHSWKHAIHSIQILRKTPYSSQSQEHESMLMSVWEQLRPNRKIKARKSEEWIELGFQVEDPATDFRGAGLLGLINLHKFVKKSEGKRAFAVADTPGTDYFFASASLFHTMLAVELLKLGNINPQYWVSDAPQESIFPLFQGLFQEIWLQFERYWDQVNDKSMMQFNMNLLAFSQEIKTQRTGQLSARLRAKKQEILNTK